MIRWLAGGPAIVMATLTCSICLEMIDSRDWHPGCGPVTRVAAFRSRYVGSRLDRRPDQAGRSMTIPALSRGSGECAIDMAGLAVDEFVGTIESIACRVMIKRRRKTRLRPQRRGRKTQHYQRQQPDRGADTVCKLPSSIPVHSSATRAKELVEWQLPQSGPKRPSCRSSR